jgi:hypothetical protein
MFSVSIQKYLLAGMSIMKNTFAVSSVLSLGLWFSTTAMAGHTIRIDSGNGTGCMSTWTTAASNAATSSFTPGGTYANAVACSASGSASVLFPNGVSANDAATVNSLYTASSGEMYQYYSGAIGVVPDAQVALWNLSAGPSGVAQTEIELNGWCPGGSGASFKFDGNSYAGGCGSSPTDLLFNTSTGALLGYVSDSTTGGASTIGTVSTLSGWTENGGALGGGGSTVAAPEIDASSAVVAVTLLAGGLAVLRGRRRIRFAR